uniref:Uncharacterized protein n=1 Tax=Oryza sativa subsp. japonica TaxID=39947 RepID=Q6EPK1_ORYSJ|nr:hypothetical protein [Oryza sativa Japonica Group]
MARKTKNGVNQGIEGAAARAVGAHCGTRGRAVGGGVGHWRRSEAEVEAERRRSPELVSEWWKAVEYFEGMCGRPDAMFDEFRRLQVRFFIISASYKLRPSLLSASLLRRRPTLPPTVRTDRPRGRA